MVFDDGEWQASGCLAGRLGELCVTGQPNVGARVDTGAFRYVRGVLHRRRGRVVEGARGCIYGDSIHRLNRERESLESGARIG
jgi:hypothetical protein